MYIPADTIYIILTKLGGSRNLLTCIYIYIYLGMIVHTYEGKEGAFCTSGWSHNRNNSHSSTCTSHELRVEHTTQNRLDTNTDAEWSDSKRGMQTCTRTQYTAYKSSLPFPQPEFPYTGSGHIPQ